MLGLLRWSVLLVVILASCSMDSIIYPETSANVAQRPRTYKNPHTLCVGCHTSEKPEPGTAAFEPGTEPSSLCLNCHDYGENHHPVDFVPPDPASFPRPLFGGKVRCLTCHEIHGGPDGEGTSKLLRGGPYADRRQICFQCHVKERYAAVDPHKMLDRQGQIMKVNSKPVCLQCHSKQPDPLTDSTNDVRFKADVGFLCWRCHPPMPGSFFDQHFLVRPSEETLRNIRETEERGLVILPLVPRGRITCSTCHNPHQEGVIQHEAAARGADSAARLRIPSPCFGCHRM